MLLLERPTGLVVQPSAISARPAPSSDPAVLVFGGFGDTAEDYAKTIELFKDEGIAAYSVIPDYERASSNDFTSYLARTVNSIIYDSGLDPGQTVFAGISLGANEAFNAAYQLRQRAGVIMISAAGPGFLSQDDPKRRLSEFNKRRRRHRHIPADRGEPRPSWNQDTNRLIAVFHELNLVSKLVEFSEIAPVIMLTPPGDKTFPLVEHQRALGRTEGRRILLSELAGQGRNENHASLSSEVGRRRFVMATELGARAIETELWRKS